MQIPLGTAQIEAPLSEVRLPSWKVFAESLHLFIEKSVIGIETRSVVSAELIEGKLIHTPVGHQVRERFEVADETEWRLRWTSRLKPQYRQPRAHWVLIRTTTTKGASLSGELLTNGIVRPFCEPARERILDFAGSPFAPLRPNFGLSPRQRWGKPSHLGGHRDRLPTCW
jgi:hypothetical protein